VTGGMLKAKTMRTYDSQGIEIKGKVRVGYKTVAYPKAEVITFLKKRKAEAKKNQLAFSCLIKE
jgi:hypothetical protein